MLYELVGSWGLQGEGLSTSRCILQCQTLRATSRCLLYIERHKSSSGPEGNAGPGLIYTASEVQVINCRNSLRSLSLARTLTSVWNFNKYKLIKRPGHNIPEVLVIGASSSFPCVVSWSPAQTLQNHKKMPSHPHSPQPPPCLKYVIVLPFTWLWRITHHPNVRVHLLLFVNSTSSSWHRPSRPKSHHLHLCHRGSEIKAWRRILMLTYCCME